MLSQQFDEGMLVDQPDGKPHRMTDGSIISTFISWTLINSNKRSAVGGSWNPGTSVLIREGAVSTWH